MDAATLAQLLRADLLAEAWIAPQATRDLRALLRHRAALVRLWTSCQNRVHGVLADRGREFTSSRVVEGAIEFPSVKAGPGEIAITSWNTLLAPRRWRSASARRTE